MSKEKIELITTRDLNVYPFHIGVIITNQKGGRINKLIKVKGEFEKDKTIFGVTTRGYCKGEDKDVFYKCIYIVLDPFSKEASTENPLDFSIIAHEIIHVKNFIFEEIQYKIDTTNDEAEAYLVGYLTKQFLEMIEELKKHESFKQNYSIKK